MTRAPANINGHFTPAGWSQRVPYSEGSIAGSTTTAVYRKPWANGDDGTNHTFASDPSSINTTHLVFGCLVRGAHVTEPESVTPPTPTV